jgi:hypothetical protein
MPARTHSKYVGKVGEIQSRLISKDTKRTHNLLPRYAHSQMEADNAGRVVLHRSG